MENPRSDSDSDSDDEGTQGMKPMTEIPGWKRKTPANTENASTSCNSKVLRITRGGGGGGEHEIPTASQPPEPGRSTVGALSLRRGQDSAGGEQITSSAAISAGHSLSPPEYATAVGFTPYVIYVEPGQDVGSIIAFAHHMRRSVWILSGHGRINFVTSSRSLLTYEGSFNMVSLSGRVVAGVDGQHDRDLNIVLEDESGDTWAGAVAVVRAAQKIEVLVAIFRSVVLFHTGDDNLTGEQNEDLIDNTDVLARSTLYEYFSGTSH